MSVCSVGYPVYCTHTVSFDCHTADQFGWLNYMYVHVFLCMYLYLSIHNGYFTFINL